MKRRPPLRCRLFGHDSHAYAVNGGVPNDWFTVRSYCRRCHADTSITVPSRFTIINARIPEEGQ